MISALVSSQAALNGIVTEEHSGGLGLPSISWSGKVPGQGGKGVFIITADQIEGRYEDVLADWEFGPVFLGGGRKDAYYTSEMTAVPVAWRTCWVKHDDNRRLVGRWGKYTKRTPDMAGSKTNTQVVVYLPSLRDYALLGLSGVSKTVAWDNDRTNTRYASYPLGILQNLNAVAQAASDALSEQHGSLIRIAPNMTFMVTMKNFDDDTGNPQIFEVGGGAKTSQMFLPAITVDPEQWEKLYVGDGMYTQFVDKYVSEFQEWVQEWPSAGVIGEGTQPATNASVAQTIEEDDVPF